MAKRFFALCALAIFAGCNSSDSGPLPTSAHVPPKIDLPPGFNFNDQPSPTQQSKLRAAKYSEIETETKKHYGKIVVVIIWESLSDSGIATLEQIAKLRGQRADENVAFASVLTDAAEKQAIAAVLVDTKEIDIPHFLIQDPAQMKWINATKPGALPAVVILGRDGKIAHTFLSTSERQVNFEAVDKSISELVKK